MNNKIKKFEDLNVWKSGMNVTAAVYEELKNCKDFRLRDQLQRAAVSIPSNIAEGFERNTNKDFIRFLYIAKSSSGELRTQLYLCRKMRLIPEKNCKHLIKQTRKISAMIYKLIQTRYEHFS